MIDKIVKDGKVAVAVSFDYGAGWSTWNQVDPMDAQFNKLFLEGKHDEAENLCIDLKLGSALGAKDVKIVWVNQGEKFIITEYDGFEKIKFQKDFEWSQA